jgi:hypothetical protein
MDGYDGELVEPCRAPLVFGELLARALDAFEARN